MIVRELGAGLDLTALHALNPGRYPFLLESVLHGGPQARFDILFAFPGESVTLTSDGLSRPDGVAGDTFTAALDDWWQGLKQTWSAEDDNALPFRGGWFLYLGYELASEIEPTLKLPAFKPHFPVAKATRVPLAVVRDHATATTWLVAEAGYEDKLDQLEADVSQVDVATYEPIALERLAEDPPQRYTDGVRRVLDYIREGDVFQVNLSRQWQGKLSEDVEAVDLYRQLSGANPAPFAALVNWGQQAIVSSSPERLVRVRGGVVDTRPIAGTRPRHGDQNHDGALSRELLAHPKERAEHVMLIDLERNDLGRVCESGTVEVDEFMTLESYAHVHHIVSNVRGKLRPETTPGEVIRACFPGGTITGCPKVRCMEIIAELEAEGRGPYTGSVGYLNRDGDMDLNILIRSIVRDGQQLTIRAGAGLVFDSDASHELAETRSKAKGVLRSLSI